MSVLVTGASGFVGSAVVRKLIARGEPVRVLARPTSPRGNFEGLNCEIVEGDLRDAASLARAMNGISDVFHVAADYRLWARNPNRDHREQSRRHAQCDAGGQGRRRRAHRLHQLGGDAEAAC